MILSDLRRYLEARGQAPLADIALHFDVEPDAVRGMLAVWERKGKVRREKLNASCGSSCSQCDPVATEVYIWLNSAPDRNRIPVCGLRITD